MAKARVKNTLVQFWAASEMDAAVRRIAQAEGRTASAVYRDLLEKGLIAGGYRAGGQDLATLVREAVSEQMQPQVERLAAISAKGTQIAAASFFLAAYTGRKTVPEYLQEEYDSIAAQARKLGVEYLKLSRDRGVDSFISQGLERMEREDE